VVGNLAFTDAGSIPRFPRSPASRDFCKAPIPQSLLNHLTLFGCACETYADPCPLDAAHRTAHQIHAQGCLRVLFRHKLHSEIFDYCSHVLVIAQWRRKEQKSAKRQRQYKYGALQANLQKLPLNCYVDFLTVKGRK